MGILKRLASSRLYVVRGASMTRTLRPGDQVLVNLTAYGEVEPARGDIVVFSAPRTDGRHDIKRVVGLPGERVVMAEGVLYIDDSQIAEPYLGGLPSSVGLGQSAWDLGPGEYLVLGDNRAHSTDSRDVGPVEAGGIVGRAWMRYWPLTAWGRLDAR